LASDRIRELIEEVLESGRTPDEVCADCPELLPAVRRRLRQIRRVERGLRALFPSGAAQGARDSPAPDHELLAHADETLMPTRPVRRLECVAIWLWQRRVAIAALVLLLALLAVIGGAGLWLRQRQKSRQNEKPIREGAGQAVDATCQWTAARIARYNFCRARPFADTIADWLR
jgi:hypothetical protein